jgi:hypothetical protein
MTGDNKKLIPFLVVLGLIMCGCLAIPAVGGMAMFAYLLRGSSRSEKLVEQMGPEDSSMPALTDSFGAPLSPTESFTDGFGSGATGGSKDAAHQRMLEAEARYVQANAQYEAAQSVYEVQRNNHLAQAGRLAAQGVNLPPPQPPDPSLAFEAEAARQAYEAAKAEYEALP